MNIYYFIVMQERVRPCIRTICDRVYMIQVWSMITVVLVL